MSEDPTSLTGVSAGTSRPGVSSNPDGTNTGVTSVTSTDASRPDVSVSSVTNTGVADVAKPGVRVSSVSGEEDSDSWLASRRRDAECVWLGPLPHVR